MEHLQPADASIFMMLYALSNGTLATHATQLMSAWVLFVFLLFVTLAAMITVFQGMSCS
jgi:hypothetical protein